MERRDEAYYATYRERSDAHAALPAGLIVRPATPTDCEGLAALVQERQGGALEPYFRRFQEELATYPTEEHNLLLVAAHNDRVLGFCRARRHERQENAPPNAAPVGWYLSGLMVAVDSRRRGIGAELTLRRLQWIAARADEAYYFTNARNLVSIALHARFGFVELTRDFVLPGANFEGGVGILFRVELPLDGNQPR